jgi:hypothetical protein
MPYDAAASQNSFGFGEREYVDADQDQAQKREPGKAIAPEEFQTEAVQKDIDDSPGRDYGYQKSRAHVFAPE